MDGGVAKKKEQAQALIKQGLYDQAVIVGGQMLESLYRWLYKEVQPRLKPQEQQGVLGPLKNMAKPLAI